MNKQLCPVCRQENKQTALQQYTEPITRTEYSLFRCSRCDVEFWIPLTMPPASYYEKIAGGYDGFYQNTTDAIRWWHKTFFDKFSSLQLKGKILDVGCADGRFLKKMKHLGWEIYGLDLDRLSVAVAREKCETENIYHKTLDEFVETAPLQSFDVITFFEVLEHQPDPDTFMSNIKKLLKDGDMIAGSVPNRDRYVVKTRFTPDNPPNHFTLWTSSILQKFFTLEGFSSFRYYHTRYEPILINRLMVAFAYPWIMKMKNDMGAHSIRQLRFSEDFSMKQSMVMLAQKYLWTPLLRIVGFVEYAFLLATRKSVSLFFEARWGK